MCSHLSDKQPKMKDLISLFYSNLKCLNTRLFILFEHTDYIFIQLVLVKDLFQTKKRNYFLESDSEEKPRVRHFYTTCIRTQYFRHKPLFPQQKQKEFELEFSLHEYLKRLSSFDDFSAVII